VSGAATWLIAAAAGMILAAASYVWALPSSPAGIAAAALRWLAASLLVALVLDAPVGRAGGEEPVIALDASRSWRTLPDEAWQSARTAAAAADSVLLFGDSVRTADGPPLDPMDVSSSVAPLADRAAASGRPIRILTDGHVSNAEALARLPRGSTVEVLGADRQPDMAVVALEAPPAAVSGDTINVRVAIAAGSAGAPERSLAVQLGSSRALVRLQPMSEFGENEVVVRLPVSGADGEHVLLASLVTDDSFLADGVPANDTLGVAIGISPAAGAVLVSTSPDYDVRGLLAVLRGTSQLPTRAYLRVTQGAWREEGSFAPVAEAAVRAAVRAAPLVVLHGDTTVFGRPAEASRGALLLMPVPTGDAPREWYPVGSPVSPLSAALSGVPWDSLAPLSLAGAPSGGSWRGLELARNRGAQRASPVAGWETQPRRAVVAASGFWRWEFRGGEGVNAYGSFWGALLDWLSAERVDPRAMVPDEPVMRAGEPVAWRRTSAADSTVQLTLRRIGSLSVDQQALESDTSASSLSLEFLPGESVATSPPLSAGRWRAQMNGGSAIVVVNPARELLPLRPTVTSGEVGAAPVVQTRRSARSIGWLYLLVVAFLCTEWLLRRRSGLR